MLVPSTVTVSLLPNEAAGTGLAGSVMLIIWTPWSKYAVTSAYVPEPIVAVAMPKAPSSLSKVLLAPLTVTVSPSSNDAAGTGLAGSVMSIIWTPPVLPCDVTSAYVLEPILTVVMWYGLESSSKISLTPSTLSPLPNEAAGTGLVGAAGTVML